MSDFLNATHEISELVLVKIAPLVDRSRLVLPLRSDKVQEFKELWREKCARAPWTFAFKVTRTDNGKRPKYLIIIKGPGIP